MQGETDGVDVVIRDISFDIHGNIIVATETVRDEIHSGVVLLTPEQVELAKEYGWEEISSTASEIEHGLRRVKR